MFLRPRNTPGACSGDSGRKAADDLLSWVKMM